MKKQEVLERHRGSMKIAERYEAVMGPSVTVPFSEGEIGEAKIKVFTKRGNCENSGVVISFSVEGRDVSFLPAAENTDNGVDLHITGKAELVSMISALKAILAIPDLLPNNVKSIPVDFCDGKKDEVKEEKIDAYLVAVAYLLGKKVAHYKKITDFIIQTKLTVLGKKSATPHQTLGAHMRQKSEVFESHGGGMYSLQNPQKMKTDPHVIKVSEKLKNMNLL